MQETNALIPDDNSREALPPLQPLSLTEILDGMFVLYRENFKLFFPMILIYFIISYVIDKIGIYFIIGGTPIGILIGLFFSVVCSILLSTYIIGAILYGSSQLFLGKSITTEAAMQQSSQVYLTMLGGFTVYILVTVGLFITCIGIPFAVYMFVRWGLYSLPILVEGTSVGASLRRSSELVKGNWGRVFLIILAILLIYYMISFILSITVTFVYFLIPGTGGITLETSPLETFTNLFAPTPDDIGWIAYSIRSFFGIGINALLLPIASIGTTLLYFDMRIRKEALDLEMQATQNLDQNPTDHP